MADASSAPAADVNTLRARLEKAGQSHLLAFFPGLTPEAQRRLLGQIAQLDLDGLDGLVEHYVLKPAPFTLPGHLEPAPYFGADGRVRRGGNIAGAWDRAAAKSTGEALIRAGKVAAFVVAGGQGSRLGFEGPKGCFPATPVTGKTLFEVFGEQILATGRKYGVPVPWYVMTSPLNHEATVAFFREKKFFGLREQDVMFFPQGVMPSLDIRTGKLLMAGKDEVATNPDGHGGSLKALQVSGAIADMKRRGVEQISYFQVDNPLVRIIDPVFLGLHVGAGGGAAENASSGEMSSKMIPKAYAEEKMGVFCLADGKLDVIEYTDMPAALSKEATGEGALRFNAGSIAIHCLSVEFVERLNNDPKFSLPYHRAEKKIPAIDPETGAPVTPEKNNGVKLERFVFDALPRARASIVLETVREEEFAPIKNATGVDSVVSSKDLQVRRAARWLTSAGAVVPLKSDGTPDCVLELSPLTALEPEDLLTKEGRGRVAGLRIERGMEVAV